MCGMCASAHTRVCVCMCVCVCVTRRTELYPTPYTSINWDKARNQVAKEDLYYPHPFVQVRVCVCLYVCVATEPACVLPAAAR